MVLVTKNGEIINFDNVVSIYRFGKTIVAHTVVDSTLTIASYDSVEEAREVLIRLEGAFTDPIHI